jgi:hypothetical protein
VEDNTKQASVPKKRTVPKNLQGVKGLKPFPKNLPAVFMFQPTHYKMVSTPDELKEWERMMIEHVGMSADVFRSRQEKRGAISNAMMVRGESISGSGDGWDD